MSFKEEMKEAWEEGKRNEEESKRKQAEQKEKAEAKKEKRRNPEGGMRVFWLCMFWLYIILSVVSLFSLIGIPLLILFVPFSIWIWNNRLRGTKKKEVVVEKHYVYTDKKPEEEESQ